MADPEQPVVTTETPAVEQQPAPATEAIAAVEKAAVPAEAPVVPVAVEAQSVPEASPVVEEVKAEEAPKPEPTLLQEFDAEKKADTDKPGEKPDEKTEKVEKPEIEAKPLDPVEYKYELPETLKMDDALKGEVHAAFDEFRKNPSEGAQKLVDLHARQMQAYAEELGREQWRVFNDTRKGWRTEVMADPELGGSGYRTSMGAIARMRDMFVSEKDRPAFDDFLKVTGAGDHPAFLRMLHRAARLFDEPPLPPAEPKPVPNNGRAPGNGRRVLYDHPTSQSNR